jgi:hypothetical protein
MPQGKGTYGSKVGRPKKNEYADEQPEGSLTQKTEHSGLGKTLLTSKSKEEWHKTDDEDNPMKRKVGYQN